MSREARGVRGGGRGLLFAAFLLTLSVRPAWAVPPAQSAADGEAIFQDQCAGCHTVGGGRLIGPDLAGVTRQRDEGWLARFIAAPDEVLAEGDSIANALLQEFNNVRMPNLGLSQEQVAAVIAYLNAQEVGSGAVPPTQTSTSSLPAGSQDRGEALFMGNVDFRQHGPPCMGCHNLGRSGALGGGVLGPDLGQAFAKYGDAGLALALANIPFPTMKPIYGGHPLATEEQADLRAFIQARSGQKGANYEVPILALSVAGFVAAMIAAAVVWRRRLRRVRRPLVERARSGR